jgi:hypothetical protein
MTDVNALELDEGGSLIDPDEPELEADPLPDNLPDDVRSGVDEAAYNPPEDDPSEGHTAPEEPS